ncbi:hypothetical protein FNF27_02606 [Cafeteria roenbergensis]|uniref:Yos1-like protein n=1 Tax=Cafeteria roenbergensis TaxID=33653 RepID=A0A5A8DK04_CAFRO|nr:hypothetical protein FNF29_05214 [Cafeteria roenbergensis]KAA0159363.1 hypothetical protein FNF28_05901 [Cafeteria roenbergensis]KAA0164181.1 hypothetical protein FNF31_02417 [Cafeteria roenbergensis]KAA0175885.1 hypothetical protein FNF27_02606 [Cafeteria roenbergensis]|eukprot:KAA0150639.1 hypothetical protein FNF29_05214 [Cafeteria roenbergensis]
MGFSLYNILKFGVLIFNALAILHDKRVLAPMGFSRVASAEPVEADDSGPNWKRQVGELLAYARLFQWPLVIANVTIITLELLFGGG